LVFLLPPTFFPGSTLLPPANGADVPVYSGKEWWKQTKKHPTSNTTFNILSKNSLSVLHAGIGIEIRVSLTWVSGQHGSFASPQTRIWIAIFAFCIHTYLRISMEVLPAPKPAFGLPFLHFVSTPI